MAQDGSEASEVSIEELCANFASLDFNDKAALLVWLEKVFRLCAAARTRVPNEAEVIQRFHNEFNLVLGAETEDVLPADYEHQLDWLLLLSLNVLKKKFDDFYLYYGVTSRLIAMTLSERPPQV